MINRFCNVKMKRRTKTGILYILTSIFLSIVLGALFAFLPGKRSYLDSFLYCSKFFYFLFCAGLSVSGILLLVTNIQEDFSFNFGMGIYYGTVFTSKFLSWLLDSEKSEIIFIAFAITSLISYIVWLTNYKDRE